MNAFRVEEDMPIESGDAYPQSGRRSEKVETYYYDIRKQVFEYDEVMNQRRAITLSAESWKVTGRNR